MKLLFFVLLTFSHLSLWAMNNAFMPSNTKAKSLLDLSTEHVTKVVSTYHDNTFGKSLIPDNKDERQLMLLGASQASKVPQRSCLKDLQAKLSKLSCSDQIYLLESLFGSSEFIDRFEEALNRRVRYSPCVELFSPGMIRGEWYEQEELRMTSDMDYALRPCKFRCIFGANPILHDRIYGVYFCLEGHMGDVYSTTYTLNEQFMVSKSDKHILSDLRDRPPRWIPLPDGELFYKFSPDGKYMLTYKDHYKIYALGGNEIIRSVRIPKCEHEIRFAQFSPSGRFLVMQSRGTIFFWDVHNDGFFMPSVIEGHKELLDMVVFSPDNNRMLTVSDDIIYFWNIESGEPSCRVVVPVHSKSASSECGKKINGVRFSKDSRYMEIDSSSRISFYDLQPELTWQQMLLMKHLISAPLMAGKRHDLSVKLSGIFKSMPAGMQQILQDRVRLSDEPEGGQTGKS